MKKIALIVMGLVLAVSVRAGFGEKTAGAASAPATQAGVRVELTSPMEWQVFQRKSTTDGRIHVEGRVEGARGGYFVHAIAHFTRDVNLSELMGNANTPNGNVVMGSDVISDSPDEPIGADGKFAIDLPSVGNGWQDVEVDVISAKHLVTGVKVNHVGVGEVFVVGGQSNSTNWGEVRTNSETGLVTVFDGKEWTVAADPLPGVDAGQGKGSPWCTFGDLMYKRLGVPIGIVPVGKGSTSVRQWLPKGDVVEIEPTRTYGLKKNAEGKWESEGTLFDRMVERMKALGPNGFRAMLWHQGESDAHQGAGHTLPGKEYRADLERVIGESRKEVGWEVPWFVATASWGSPTSPEDPDIRAAQAGVVADGFAMAGPDTDKLIGENRQKNGTGVHMSAKGLRAHGGLWAEIVGKWVDEKLETQNTKHKTE